MTRTDYRTWQRKSLGTDILSMPESNGMFIQRDGNALMMTSISAPVVDATRMTAKAIINTDAVDYQDEVIVASGVRTTNYANNPVVLWEHGKTFTDLPIGRCKTPDGLPALIQTDTTIEAECTFSQTFPFARQVFAMIDEDIIRATSIQVIPSVVAVYRSPEGREVLVTEESDMVEWSWTAIGVNPEALRSKSLRSESLREALTLQVDRAARVLNRGTLGGESLMPAIRKSLLSMVPKSKGLLINPFDREEESQMKTLTGDEIGAMDKAALKSLVMDEYDESSKALIKSALDAFGGDAESDDYSEVVDDATDVVTETEESEDAEGAEEAVAETEAVAELVEEVTEGTAAKSLGESGVDSKGMMKLGARVLMEAYDGMDYLAKYFQAAVEPVENEPVKQGVMAVLSELSDSLDALRGLYSTAYPDLPALGSKETSADEGVAATQMKSLLASSQTRQFKVLGINALVNSVRQGSNLTEGQRKSLDAVSEKLTRMVDAASKYKAPIPAGYVPEAQLKSMQSKFERVLKRVEEKVLPAS
jgi:hypothetical protein